MQIVVMSKLVDASDPNCSGVIAWLMNFFGRHLGSRQPICFLVAETVLQIEQVLLYVKCDAIA